MKNKKEIPLSRKGILKSYITFSLLIIFSVFLIGATPVAESSSNFEVYEEEIIREHINNLEIEGYQNIEKKEKIILKNNYYVYHQTNLNKSLEEIIIEKYNYITTYYYININEKEYLFKSLNDINNFVNKVKVYNKDLNYQIQEKRDIINKETKEEELNTLLLNMENDYKKKQEEEKERQRKIVQQQQQYNNNNNNVNELQKYAYNLVINTYGWTENDFSALVKLWDKESKWNPNSHNSKSGAHGIPQALPASKMASEGSDYYTNGKTQIRWGLKYIKERYGSPTNAWNHFLEKNWY